MEVVGSVASIIGIGTLAVQLGNTLNKAAEFWDSVQDAPTEIRRVSRELRLLAQSLNTIEYEYKIGSIQDVHERMVRDALDLAKGDVDELATLVSDLARRMGNDGSIKRRWGRIKSVLKEEKVLKLKDNVESAKSILNLLRQSRTQWVYSSIFKYSQPQQDSNEPGAKSHRSTICQMNGKLEILATKFESISIASVQSQEPIPVGSRASITPAADRQRAFNSFASPSTLATLKQVSQNFLQAGFGTLQFRSTSVTQSEMSKDETENPKIVKFFVATLILNFSVCRRGFRISSNNNFTNWTFNTFRRRPSSSDVFRFCRQGNTGAVRELIHCGEASVFDIDDYGDSLLHVCHTIFLSINI